VTLPDFPAILSRDLPRFVFLAAGKKL